jgi:hypothetical protein
VATAQHNVGASDEAIDDEALVTEVLLHQSMKLVSKMVLYHN